MAFQELSLYPLPADRRLKKARQAICEAAHGNQDCIVSIENMFGVESCDIVPTAGPVV